jgi:hypothetical protein
MSQIRYLLGTTMYVSKESANELVIQSKKPSLFNYLLTFSIYTLFLGVPSFMLLSSVLAPFGGFNLSCNRIEPNLVECEYTHNELFGLIKEPITKTGLIKEAKLNSETKTDSEGDAYTVHSVALVSDNTSNTHIIHESYQPNKVAKIALEINSFINSNKPSIILEIRDWEEGGFNFIYILLTAFTFLWIIIVFLAFKQAIETIKNPRKFILSVNSNLFTDKIGEKSEQYTLSQITQIEQEKHEDSDGPDSYILKLVLSSGDSYTLMNTVDEEEASLVKRKIEDFIKRIK